MRPFFGTAGRWQAGEGHMGFLIAILAVLTLVALMRIGKLRDSFNEQLSELKDRIRDLEAQIAMLRRNAGPQEQAAPSQGREAPNPVVDVAASRPTPATTHPPEAKPSPSPAAGPIPAGVRLVAEHSTPSPTVPFRTPTTTQALGSLSEGKRSEPARPQPVPASAPQPAVPRFASIAPDVRKPAEAQPPRRSVADWLRTTLPMEEVLGLNLFAKIGIVLLVLGFALLGRVALVSMGPGARVALIYAAGSVLLGGGIWLEGKERYRLVGRTGIGGGWALLFFTTYALSHVAPMTVLRSNTADCVLMLIVAIAMVVHTLRYRSQLVTGLAFLLAFSTVALSQDTVYSLAAGVILALGIVAIALRMGWFELEIFGILASFANHFYWLYKLYPEGVAGHAFPQFWPSCIILVLYWVVFRISYVVRSLKTPRDEMLSSIAAILNPVLLLATMKFQSTRPELAFYALLGLGLIEFQFGQLPVTKRRRAAFVLLSVLGTILIFASVPFKFSGNNIALLWMIAAEVLLVAGVAQKEYVFRRLGLIGGLFTGLLVIYESSSLVEFRQSSQRPLTQDGALLLACSLLFYGNALFLRRRWKDLFVGMEQRLAIGQSYLGALTAFLGSWAVFTGDWTAVAWALLMLTCAWGKRSLDDNHLLVQAMGFAAAALSAVYSMNVQLTERYPHHAAGRLITLPLLACVFYLTYWILREGDDLRVIARRVAIWAGSSMLATLAWTDVKQSWLPLVWIALAALLGIVGRRLDLEDLPFQEHVLAIMGAVELAVFNIDAASAMERYVPIAGSAVILYAVSRFCTTRNASYARPAAWVHTCGGTALLAALAWHEAPQPWLSVIWAVFALGLALTDRIFGIEEFPWQAHALAAGAVIRAVTLNFYLEDKFHGVDVRLLTIAILIAVLYALAVWVRMPASPQSADARHAYTWIGSGLLAWLMWTELQPVSVALGWAILGFVLFEMGQWRGLRQLRLQGYAGLVAAFVRIFFVNLTAAALPGETISPRIYTVAPIALIYFFIWAQLQSKKAATEPRSTRVADLIAYLGTISIVSLIYFEVRPEPIIVAWAVMVAALLGASLWLGREVFLHQGELLSAGIVIRAMAHNLFGGSYFTESGWRGNIGVLSLASALLLLTLPIAFRLRAHYVERGAGSLLVRNLALRHPEQILFFAPVLLISVMIVVKLNPGMITLAWGIEGVMVIVLGLVASQRSYRLTGLLLLLLCVGKIVVRDAWHLAERDRYITFIALGAALTLVSTLYGKYRETVRKLL